MHAQPLAYFFQNLFKISKRDCVNSAFLERQL